MEASFCGNAGRAIPRIVASPGIKDTLFTFEKFYGMVIQSDQLSPDHVLNLAPRDERCTV